MNTYTIDMPPSANKLYRNATARDNVRGRIKTAVYKRWRDLAAIQLKMQRRGEPMLMDNVSLGITANRYHPLADLSNLIKPIEDALQSAGIFKNDRQVSHLDVAWANHPDCRVTVGPDVS